MTGEESSRNWIKSPLLRSLGILIYSLVIYLGLTLLGWAAAGGLRGFFDHPARTAFIALLVLQELLAAVIRWRLPEPAVRREEAWFNQLTSERWRFLNLEMIYALAPFSDRQGIAVIPGAEWLRYLGLALFAAAGAWMLWAVLARRRHLPAVSAEAKEPLLVTSGPYRLVRHPLFLWVLVSGAAVSLVFRSIGGLFLVFLMIATVMRRMRWMESDASKAVPLQWSAYSRRTRRLIPGIY